LTVAIPGVTGVLETALHVADLEKSARFYEQLFEFRKLFSDKRLCAFSVADRQVLLLFQRGATLKPVKVEGGFVPPHDATGRMHVAFAIPATELEKWRERLETNGLKIESHVRWDLGGQSLFFRDPDQHLVELATPGTWQIY
jgi:catechol 2,3-dioxygenase-like lactoylglutathione lyase family enzyme